MLYESRVVLEIDDGAKLKDAIEVLETYDANIFSALNLNIHGNGIAKIISASSFTLAEREE